MRLVAEAVRASRWIPTAPELKQLQLLAATEGEVLYGGQVGGGKSEALLMDAALYADEPDYSALIVRRNFSDLALRGALMHRAAEWWGPSGATWNDREKTWTFPSGASITFGYLDGPLDHLRYQGAAFHRILIDESTQIREYDIRYLFSRRRRTVGSRVPIALRLATNPGGESHEYHVENFVSPREPDPSKRFIPAGLEDNPYLDTEEYEQSLENLDETTYRQLRHGEWIERTDEAVFKRAWWVGQNRYRAENAPAMWNATRRRYAALDTANTVGQTSAYTALTVGEILPDYRMALRNVAREKLEFPELVEWTVVQLLPLAGPASDGKFEALLIENAASGTQLIQTLRRSGPAWLAPRVVAVPPNRGPNGKEAGWKNAAVWSRRGMVLLPEPSDDAPWLYDFEKELFTVPNAAYKDQADSYSLLVNEIERRDAPFSSRWHSLGARVA